VHIVGHFYYTASSFMDNYQGIKGKEKTNRQTASLGYRHVSQISSMRVYPEIPALR
jgi:hypothetical protein